MQNIKYVCIVLTKLYCFTNLKSYFLPATPQIVTKRYLIATKLDDAHFPTRRNAYEELQCWID